MLSLAGKPQFVAPQKGTARPSPKGRAVSGQKPERGDFPASLGVGLAACREKAGNAKGCINADETDQNDFDNAHDVSPVFRLPGLSRPPMIERYEQARFRAVMGVTARGVFEGFL